jgi:hypothetical protein
MVHDVFLSYSSKDKTTADAVCATLEKRGIRCWIAPRDIRPGLDWGGAIIDAINQARVMVLIYSGQANKSQQIKREVERAVSKGVTIVPVRIEDVPPGKTLEYFISSSHWLDAFTPPLESHLEQLAETVGYLLTRRDSTSVPLAAPTTAPAPARASSAIPATPALAPPGLAAGRGARKAAVMGGIALAALLISYFTLRGGSPPEILGIEFPPTIPAGSKDALGSIRFKDPQGDVVAAKFDVVEATQFEAFRVDRALPGEKEGRFSFSLHSATPQRITLEATLIDKGRRQSRPLRFSFEVTKPATRKPSSKQRWQIDLPHFKFRNQ